jgi:hypothetical protein
MQKVVAKKSVLGYTLAMQDTSRHEALANEVYELNKSIWGFKPNFSQLLACSTENLENQLAQLKTESGLFEK